MLWLTQRGTSMKLIVWVFLIGFSVNGFGSAVFSGGSSGVVSLTDATSVEVDSSLGSSFRLASAAGNRTIAAPTNAVDGKKITIWLCSDGTPRTFTLATGSGAYIGSTDLSLTLSATEASKCDALAFEYIASASRWRFVAITKGF